MYSFITFICLNLQNKWVRIFSPSNGYTFAHKILEVWETATAAGFLLQRPATLDILCCQLGTGGDKHPPTLNCPLGGPPFTFFSIGAYIYFPHINFYSSYSRPINLLQRLWQKTQHLGRTLSSEEEGLFTSGPRLPLVFLPLRKWNCINDHYTLQ